MTTKRQPMTRDLVKVFAAAQQFGGASHHRLPLDTDQAVELARLLEEGEARHADQLKAALVEYDELAKQEEPSFIDEKVKYYQAHGEVAKEFWDAFEGQEVEGVEIIRRR